MRPVALFVYGSLLAPVVLRALLDRVPASEDAYLPDHRRSALRGHRFPAVFADSGAMTAGVLLRLSRRELACLDAWEDDFFHRRSVRVLGAQGAATIAQAYVLAPHHRHLIAAHNWDPEEFCRLHAPACAARARRDRDRSLRHTSCRSPLP